MSRRYEHLKLPNFTKKMKDIAKKVGLTDFLKSEEGKMMMTEFHQDVKSADGSSDDDQFMRAIHLAEEKFQYHTLECFSIRDLAPEERQRYIHLYKYVEKIVRGEGGNPPMSSDDAMEIVVWSVLDELRNSGLSVG